MTGLIWLIQLVYYPSFYFVDRGMFQRFCTFHQKRITLIVALVMTFELTTSAILFWCAKNELFHWFNFTGLLAIWLVTLFLSMPQHRILSNGFEATSIKKLVATNWLRTALWSMRSIALLAYL